MEYNHPFQYMMIMNKDKVYVKDGQKENTVSSKSNKVFQQINKITVDCMQGTFLNNADFKSKIFENKASFLVELMPTAKGIKDIFKTIVIIIDKRDYSVNSIQMNEQSGDDTLIKFNNKELNTNISDALFAIK
jgi:outer membrane lipoprotein-sorting protein